MSAMKETIKVVVSGAAGQICYNLLFRIAKGDAFGCDQPVHIVLLEYNHPKCIAAAEGVAMELDDCAFPLLAGYTITGEQSVGFKDVDYAVLVGAMPRKDGMTRSDLLVANKAIFVEQGKAIEAHAKDTCKVLVVGNPANTNAMVLSEFAPKLARENITAMSRLDHNRTIGQLSKKIGCLPGAIKNVVVFGNHAKSMVPVVAHGNIDGTPILEVLGDDDWVRDTMVPCVKTRGGAIIKARGKSSAASAANAALDHLHSWHCGTPEGEFVSMSVLTVACPGNPYGVPAGVCYSMPCSCKDGKWTVVDLPVCEETKRAIKASEEDLFGERKAALGEE
eukprot:gnl/Dysnectes_brevis/910_a1011_4197.p1 GENE.gnl/Dysnectes_brevis/910_a1011_4197~~gnl/Dysnectes_brevis/910_a1011_4197.p1  ORF type:complete len:335 (+),score=137.82 gnl/Dysnectes_brevis/910_a1011_4197:47-1051(+)